MQISSQRKVPVARAPESPAPPAAVVAGIPRVEIHCASCGWRSVCLPRALNFVELGQFDQLIGRERRLKRDQSLFVAGSAFRSLYALRSGAIKTTIVAEDGREQIAGYHIEGEIIGTDGIATTRHACTAVAAIDTEFCAMPFERLETLAQSVPGLQHNLYRLLSQELAGHHQRMLMLGSMDARERLAAFLLDLSDRLRRRDRSPIALTLHLSREELGSYLGLKLETVSRGFSRMQAAGILQVQGREIKLLDLPSLRTLLGRDPREPRA
jgi:CRP/FNR family transcriptional regulator, anaerobic regulatory protein